MGSELRLIHVRAMLHDLYGMMGFRLREWLIFTHFHLMTLCVPRKTFSQATLAPCIVDTPKPAFDQRLHNVKAHFPRGQRPRGGEGSANALLALEVQRLWCRSHWIA